MILLTPELHERLLANGRQRDADHVPVVKFFNPFGAATWLATELDEDGDTLFGLADLGFGCPELGSFSLTEMASVRLPLGLGIERDLFFEGTFPLSVYAAAAHAAGQIVLDEELLQAAAEALRTTE
ncbi:MAG: DUF2958 domain-containing protein [Hyphomicrobium sp.]